MIYVIYGINGLELNHEVIKSIKDNKFLKKELHYPQLVTTKKISNRSVQLYNLLSITKSEWDDLEEDSRLISIEKYTFDSKESYKYGYLWDHLDNFDREDYVIVGSLYTVKVMIEEFGTENVFPIFISEKMSTTIKRLLNLVKNNSDEDDLVHGMEIILKESSSYSIYKIKEFNSLVTVNNSDTGNVYNVARDIADIINKGEQL